MLTEQRKMLLLERLALKGRLVAKDLSAELAVSEDTIRRDLRELAAEGRLLRVHGGALPIAPPHAPFRKREVLMAEEKTELARLAVQLIASGSVCFIDGGTTHAALLNALPADFNGTLITHSPTIASATERLNQVTCLLVGGTVFKHSMVALGSAAHTAIADMRFDLAFIGGTAFHPDHGLMTADREEALFKTAVAKRASAVAVLLTSDKIGASAPFKIMDTEDITTLVLPDVPHLDMIPDAVDILRLSKRGRMAP
jgi:DeoR/GlpR family transcriptional regulator of sugar metabolism